MIILGKGSVYMDGTKVGELSSAWAETESQDLSKHFKSVSFKEKRGGEGMDVEMEVRRIKAIVGDDAEATELLEVLNRALLAGVGPSSVIEVLSRLEKVEREFLEIQSIEEAKE